MIITLVGILEDVVDEVVVVVAMEEEVVVVAMEEVAMDVVVEEDTIQVIITDMIVITGVAVIITGEIPGLMEITEEIMEEEVEEEVVVGLTKMTAGNYLIK